MTKELVFGEDYFIPDSLKHIDIEVIQCDVCEEFKGFYGKSTCDYYDEDGEQVSNELVYHREGVDGDFINVCIYCEEAIDMYGSSIKIHADDKTNEYPIRYYKGIIDGEEDFVWGLEDPIRDDVKTLLYETCRQTGWRSSDAWRGRDETTPNDIIFEVDDLPQLMLHHSLYLNEQIMKALNQSLTALNLPFLYIHHRTSNVCFINTQVIALKKHEEQITNIIKFIKYMYNDDDSRWNANVIFQSDYAKSLGLSAIEDIENIDLVKAYNEGMINWFDIAKGDYPDGVDINSSG